MLVGIGLLFPCVVLTQVLWDVLLAARTSPDVLLPVPALALTLGALLWVLLFVFFPQPLRTYVLAHELTHALWGVLMGARVSRIRVKADHGSVVLSKTNYFITLAPYFFPLYTVLAILIYAVLHIFCDLRPYKLFWLGLVGFTWAFHVTFTLNALLQRQTDIQQEGRVFSYSFIYLANIFGVCIWVLLVTSPDWRDLVQLLSLRSSQAWAVVAQMWVWVSGFGKGVWMRHIPSQSA